MGGKGRKHGVTGKSCVLCGRGGKGGEGGRHVHRKNALIASLSRGGNDAVFVYTGSGLGKDKDLDHVC